jgi:protein disulfide-isomerase
MSSLKCLLIACLFIATQARALAAPLSVGASYQEVITALGKPDGELDVGSRKILTYGNAQIKFKDGTVSSISPELEKLLADRNADQDSVDAKRAAGLVNYKGKWIRPSDRDAYVARDKKQQASRAARAQALTGWTTDYKEALAIAKEQNKKVLLNFTGSDWCGWCIKLDKEVFSKKEFLDYAKDNYILVKIDYPRRTKLPEFLERQNSQLAKKYKVRGYPTVVVLKSNGKKYKTGGYVAGGPSAFIKSLK